uniref:GFA family protein n=1 Tax=Thaumasiovibrio occultus TaxID=1891184 RepID=UPI000B36218D|nr:GFA family protein [Thaumasiovibrio occultus]
MTMLKGSCLCRKVQIEVPDDFEYMGNCHCSECRKFTGADYSSVGGLSSDKFRFTAGEEFVAVYRKSEDTELAFCQCCGSSLFSRKLKTHKHNIRLGILDSPPTHAPSFHIFVASKAPWNDIADGLPQFAQGPVKQK